MRLLEEVEQDERFRALEVQCSLARGAADELSDIDGGLFVADDAWDSAVRELPNRLKRLGDVVDMLVRDGVETPYFFTQYEDGTQLDLLAQKASKARGRVPNSVVLMDRDHLLEAPWQPRSLRARAVELREWSFFAWLALSNLSKYLRRGSLWEAWMQLEEARGHLLRLHAAKTSVHYPGFGLTSLLDAPGRPLPDGLESTVARLDRNDLARAAAALADLLDAYPLPALAPFVRARLTSPDAPS